ncbi:GMC oxidoreductase [Jiulongibacter sediminis]|jgi:choline dehydrogenase-like flavoprotein|uniref:GMC oxidoreductase n=1 Tax=Jiulongibacter sediminis TaxID=1605367 RepID=UPI0026F05099|nr:GMC family oxidoreductase [Jiulongibacter sediminis]
MNSFDAIVVGSGISGGWAAKELTEKGLNVLMLERGKNIEHVKDYHTANMHPWEFEHHNLKIPLEEAKDYPVHIRSGNTITEASKHHFVKDTDHPYLESKRFDWIRSFQLGGKSITWGRVALRMSDLDFEANAKEGIGVDWPIRYKDIEPWYNYVERFAGISGSYEALPYLPDSIFQKPFDLTCVEQHMREKVLEKFGDRYVIPPRQAHLTEATEEQMALGRASCQSRAMCWRGCPYGAYFSTQSATLPAARLTERLTVKTNAIVHEVIYDDQLQKATGVRVIDQLTKEETEFFAPIIFLNASAMATTFILLNSKSKRFPEGLGNDSGQLGHNLMDHHFDAGARAEMPGFEDQYYYGRRPNGFYIPRFRNVGSDRRDYLRGFGYEGESRRVRGEESPESFGAGLKEAITRPGPWEVNLTGFAETLPYYENKVWINDSKKDQWGLPVLHFSAEIGENERKMRADMMNDAAEMLEVSGAVNIETFDNKRGYGRCIHEMGTARMGRDPKTSILNEWNQVHGAKNVFVTDGACMTSSSCVNPSLTYMALTARAADYAVSELKKGNL